MSARFISNGDRVAPEHYVAAADDVLAGRLRVFELEIAGFEEPIWNQDPQTGTIAPRSFGKRLNYRDERIVGNVKYLWEPNRHLQLVTVAQAYALTREPRFLVGIRGQLHSWLDQCPYLEGPNWTSSLELGLRLISWSLVWQLVGGYESPLFADNWRVLRERMLVAVFQQMDFIAGKLSRFSSANNHLLGELAGLYVAAVTWPHWTAAREWQVEAKRELVAEMLVQDAPDGTNREQAIAYQRFVLELLLVAGLAGRANGDEFPVAFWDRFERMLDVFASLMDVGGHIPMLGDSDDGYAYALSKRAGECPYRSLLATGAAMFARSDLKASAGHFDDQSLWWLGTMGATAFERLETVSIEPRRAYADGGYYVLGDNLGSPLEVKIIVDAGPLGYQSIAAHGHADSLAFVLSLAGRPFLIDPGTYAYHTERAWRDYFRGTAAHNTVRVDGVDQSVIAGPFMWSRHATSACNVFESSPLRDVFRGTHDGYARLADPVIHERELVLDKRAQNLIIRDTLRANSSHEIERTWHFADNVCVEVEENGTIVARLDELRFTLTPSGRVRASMYRGSESPRYGWVSHHFGTKVPTSTVVWRETIHGTSTLEAIARYAL